MKRRIKLKAFSLLILASLFGCATPNPYAPCSYFSSNSQQWRAGYEDTKLQDDLFNVAYHGNGATSEMRARNYFLYRCAEVTVQNGYDYFVVAYGASVSGEFVGGYNSAFQEKVVTPNIMGQIRLGKGQTPSDKPLAYDARQVMQNIGPEIVRPK